MTAATNVLCRYAIYIIAILMVARVVTTSATADVITFHYYNPAAVIDVYGFDYDNTLGLGAGSLTGAVMQIEMTMSFDTSTPPTISPDPFESACNDGSACGLTGSARVNGLAVPIGFPLASSTNFHNEVQVYHNGTGSQLHAQLAGSSGVPNVSTPFHYAYIQFHGTGGPSELNFPAQLANFDFRILSSSFLSFVNTTSYYDPNQFNEVCGSFVCSGYYVALQLLPDDPHVTITVVDEPASALVLAFVLLLLFIFYICKGRGVLALEAVEAE